MHIGTRATVHKVVKMPNQSLFVFTEGNERVRLGEFAQLTPFMTAESEIIDDVEPTSRLRRRRCSGMSWASSRRL